jgi:hypothetical protein
MKQLRKRYQLLLVVCSLPFWFLFATYVRALITIQPPQNAPDIIKWGAEASKLTWYFVGISSERPPPRHGNDSSEVNETNLPVTQQTGLASHETSVGPYKLRLPKGGRTVETPASTKQPASELKKYTFTSATDTNKRRGVMNLYFIAIPANELGTALIESQLSGYSDAMAKDWKGFKSYEITRMTINGLPFGRMAYTGQNKEGDALLGVAYVGRHDSVLIWIDVQAQNLPGGEAHLNQLEESIRSFRE